ncbi:helix-turn-helix transcriptional regulator [Halorarius litoreus]|uniref:helix-turn-helix transcriptional regulator n=1 Tax=Halorarius litoreus TaxID=2962676 RepID=UPI0020CCDE9C|nr:transcriptional regulator [Halorarius litoreus]
MSTPLEGIDFLARSEHRVNALGALTAGPQDREDLRAATGASNATVGRLLDEFEARNWINRVDRRYELTPLGEFIADGFFDLVERFETEQAIRDVWRWFPTDLGFTLEMFSGATVTRPDPSNPYSPNDRYAELVESSGSIREIGKIPLKPENVRSVFEHAAAGMTVELVFPSAMLAYMLGVAPDVATEAVNSGNLVLLVHDDPPGGFAIFDERVGTCCRDYETGLSRAIIDTDTAEAMEHARSLYDAYRSDATRFDTGVLVGN